MKRCDAEDDHQRLYGTPTVVTRSELYALIWERPVVQIARTLGMSNDGLRKICSDYNIPLPPPGYWTKRAHGKSVQRPPLPAPAPALLRKVNDALRRMGQEPLEIAAAQLDAFDLKLGQATPAPTWLPPSPIAEVAALEQYLSRTAPDDDGLLRCSASFLPSVTIGQATVARAVRLFDSFSAAMLGAGHTLVETEYGLCIAVEGELVLPTIYEAMTRGPVPPSRPSGRLCLNLCDPRPFQWSSSNRIGVWYDLRGRPVEDCIRLVAPAIAAATVIIRHARAQSPARSVLPDDERKWSEVARDNDDQRDGERKFIVDTANAYSDWLKLCALSDHLHRLDDSGSDPRRRMIEALKNLIDEGARQFDGETLDLELARRALFRKNIGP